MHLPMNCYHCGLPVEGRAYFVRINEQDQPMCCIGCQSVAKTIIEQGLDNYYQFRDTTAITQQNLIPPELLSLTQFDHPEIQSNYLQNMSAQNASQREIILAIDGITCAACIWLIERHIKKIPGVIDCSVNLSTHRAQLSWDNERIALSDLLIQFTSIGFIAQPYQLENAETKRQETQRIMLKRLAISGLGFGQVMMFAAPLYGWFSLGVSSGYRDFFRVASLAVTTPVLLYCGIPYFKSAWSAIKSRFITMDFSISLALIIVYLAGVYATIMRTGEVYFDSITMFLFFITLSRYLEMRSRDHSNFIIQKLSHQPPTWVTQIVDENQVISPINQIKQDDIILVKSGTTIPFDGVIIEGTSSVNESLLTGEAMPKLKNPGDTIVAGSMNVDHPLTIRVIRIGDQTTLATIIRLFERAQYEKPRIVSISQTFSHYFIILQISIAALLFAYWSFTSIDKAFWVMISMLVISCPCALALGAPIAITSAMNALSKIGFVCTRSHVLEGLTTATDVIFDKTGTLTDGKFSIRKVDIKTDQTYDEIMQIAASLEAGSEHPIASAFKHHKKIISCKNIQVRPNKGIEGDINNTRYYLGNLNYIQEILPNTLEPTEQTIYTRIMLATADQLLAVFMLEDKLKLNAESLIDDFREKNISIHLLSGDSQSNVAHYATLLGINNYRSELSPADKLDYLKQLQASGKKVVMLGDGINDAPVLMQAQVSIAMSNAADITRVNADAVLLKNDLSVISQVFSHAHKTKKIIRECLLWALLYNVISLPFAITGIVAPYLAAALMSLSSIFVVLNAIRANVLTSHKTLPPATLWQTSTG